MTQATYVTHLCLDRAAKAALVAHHTEGVTRQHHIKNVRNELASALSRCEAGHSQEAEGLLVDLVENALLDSMGIDSASIGHESDIDWVSIGHQLNIYWTSNQGARAVVHALLDFSREVPK